MAAGTGSDFGLSGDDQIVLVVRHLAEHGGRGQMAELYDAVESNLAGNMLSEQGRSSLRFFVNEVAVKKGYLQPHDPADPGWHLTEKGWGPGEGLASGRSAEHEWDSSVRCMAPRASRHVGHSPRS